jgi:quinol monooxygenase YgiN
MVQLMLRILAAPGQAPKMAAALRSLLLQTHLDRSCRSSALYAMVGQPDTFCYIEEWEDPEDIRRQILSQRFTRLLSIMETALDRPVLEFRFVSMTRGLEYAEEVRSLSKSPD